jgi:hypothetical protein
MEFIDPGFVKPDLCVTAIVFLIAAICCHICRPASSREALLAEDHRGCGSESAILGIFVQALTRLASQSRVACP